MRDNFESHFLKATPLGLVWLVLLSRVHSRDPSGASWGLSGSFLGLAGPLSDVLGASWGFSGRFLGVAGPLSDLFGASACSSGAFLELAARREGLSVISSGLSGPLMGFEGLLSILPGAS